MPRRRKPASPFRYFNSSPEVIRLVVMMYVRFPLSLRNVEDLLFERGVDLCHETVRLWWNRFGPMFAADIRRQRVQAMRDMRHWRWHLDEMYVKLNGEMVYLWRAVDHEVPRLDRVGEAARHGVDPRLPPLATPGVREEPGGQVERQQAHVTSLPAVSTGVSRPCGGAGTAVRVAVRPGRR